MIPSPQKKCSLNLFVETSVISSPVRFWKWKIYVIRVNKRGLILKFTQFEGKWLHGPQFESTRFLATKIPISYYKNYKQKQFKVIRNVWTSWLSIIFWWSRGLQKHNRRTTFGPQTSCLRGRPLVYKNDLSAWEKCSTDNYSTIKPLRKLRWNEFFFDPDFSRISHIWRTFFSVKKVF